MKTLDAIALQALTGYKHGSKQVQWVRDNLGLEPMVGADGRPRLTEHIVEQAALARRTGGVVQTPAGRSGVSSWTPNWTKAA
jgi:hypothetical protein